MTRRLQPDCPEGFITEVRGLSSMDWPEEMIFQAHANVITVTPHVIEQLNNGGWGYGARHLPFHAEYRVDRHFLIGNTPAEIEKLANRKIAAQLSSQLSRQILEAVRPEIIKVLDSA